MDTRFNQRLVDIMPLEGLIPATFNLYDDKKIIEAAKTYALDLDDDIASTFELSCLHGGNNGNKVLSQKQCLLFLIAQIFSLTFKYFCQLLFPLLKDRFFLFSTV